MTVLTAKASRSPAYSTGALTLFAAVATIVAALGFEHIGGYKPCELCLQQRWAYYATIPGLFLALALLGAEQPRIAALIFGLCGLAFAANAVLGVYHAGAEWEFWNGPATCAASSGSGLTPLAKSGDDLLKRIATEAVIPCTKPQWRLLGVSFAGYNVLISIILFLGAVKTALDARRSA